MLMKIISSVCRWVSTSRPDCADDRVRWRRDPLSHPEIDAMDERVIADLPLRGVARREIC